MACGEGDRGLWDGELFKDGELSRVRIANGTSLDKRVFVRKSGGTTLPVVTTSLVREKLDVLEKYPEVSSIFYVRRVLGDLNTIA